MSDEIRYHAAFEIKATEFCCGLYEAGGFYLKPMWKRYPSQEMWDRSEKTPEAAWKKALSRMRDEAEGCPLQMTLIADRECTSMLRQLLNEQEDAFIVHTWTNPNSSNVLELYVLTNDSKVYDSEEDE